MADGEDRISALHDELLCAIISRLPLTDAARTTAVARSWRHIWHSTPLVLDDVNLHESARDAIVSRVLADHPGPFRSVCLARCSFASLDHDLAEWPRILATKGIKRLNLINKRTRGQHNSPRPRLPAEILRCVSLRHLLLCCWTFPDDFSRGAGADVFLPDLQGLTLIKIDMRDHDLEHLIAASPVLKTIVLARHKPKRVHLRSQSLQGMVIGLSKVEEFAMVETPLLDRLLLLDSRRAVGGDYMRVKIGCAPNLRVLGFLEPRTHKLQIGDCVIEPNIMASPRIVVPSVKILALKVNFGVLGEVSMLARFLRCFPNVDTLHIESLLHNPPVDAYEPTGECHAKFWQEVSPIKCLRSNIKRMVFHKYRGYENEFEFLKFIAKDALELQSLMLVPPEENVSLQDEMKNEMIDRLGCPQFRVWISKVLVVLTKVDIALSLKNALNLTVDDPFLCLMRG